MTAPLILHTESSKAWGGQEIRVLTELTQMQLQGFRTALIARNQSPLAEHARAAGIAVHGLSDFSKLNPAVWWQLTGLFCQLRPAVVNTHSSADSWTAAPLARALGVPLVLRTRHVLTPLSSTLSFRVPHAILACSEAIAAQLAHQGIEPARICVVPTGNDETRFRFSAEQRAILRQGYDLKESDILIGNVGFLRGYKGHSFILDTLAQLEPHYKVMLVGDGDLRCQLIAQTTQLGLSERVIFAGHQEAPEAFYSAFDLFFFSSNATEGVSQALVQALLNGLPVLACKLASTAEVLSGMRAIRLVDFGDVPATVQAINELLALPRRDPTRMAAQHDLIANRYGLAAMIARLVDLYARHGIVSPAPTMPKKGG